MQVNTVIYQELTSITEEIQEQIALNNGILGEYLGYALKPTGKLLRSRMGLLLWKGLAAESDALPETIKNLLIATELIHNASLIHDDILDEATHRRGQVTLHEKYGTKKAIIVGDYCFAISSAYLAKTNSIKVYQQYSNLIKELCEGEYQQSRQKYQIEQSNWDAYLQKSHQKTASMFASLAYSVAILMGLSEERASLLYDYGKNWGTAFQMIDDLLDFTSNVSITGKPKYLDLIDGIYTAPIILALQSADRHILSDLLDSLNENIKKYAYQSEKCLENNQIIVILEQINEFLEQKNMYQETYELAKEFINKAENNLFTLHNKLSLNELKELGMFVLARKY